MPSTPVDPMLVARMHVQGQQSKLLWIESENKRIANLDRQLAELQRVRDMAAAALQEQQVRLDKYADNCHAELADFAAVPGVDQLALLGAIEHVLVYLESQEPAHVQQVVGAAKRLLSVPPGTPIVLSGCPAHAEGGWLGRPLDTVRLFWTDQWNIRLRLQATQVELLPYVKFSFLQLERLDDVVTERGMYIGARAIQRLKAQLASMPEQTAEYALAAIRGSGFNLGGSTGE